MSEKKVIKPVKQRPARDKDVPKPKHTKDPKYKHAKHWLSEDDDDEEIIDLFGKDEEE